MESDDVIHKKAQDLLTVHVLKRRYSLDELETMLSNTKERVLRNNADSLSSTKNTITDEVASKYKVLIKNIAFSDQNAPGLDINPPTSSRASSSIDHLPPHEESDKNVLETSKKTSGATTTDIIHNLILAAVTSYDPLGVDPPTKDVASIEQHSTLASTADSSLYSAPSLSHQGHDHAQLLNSGVNDPSNQNAFGKLSKKIEIGTSRKKKLKKEFELPKDYPLFESSYPPPMIDGHLCR